MPQSSDELRGIMEKRFGDPVSDNGPMQYLLDHGWTLLPSWFWQKDGISKDNLDVIPQAEWECIVFLIEEWDFGGVI